MDANRFDDLTRSLSEHPSRRRVVRGFALAALAQATLLGPDVPLVVARKKRRNKVKKNQFGCVDVGNKCYGKDAKCCSGICSGNGKRSKCAAHNEGGCSADDNSCLEPVPCGVGGECHRTTGKAGFCGEPNSCDCHPCKKDMDCESEHGAGAACIVCITNNEGTCVGVNGSKGTACVAPAPLP
ncbi:MAG: hypothetical protein ACRDJC_14435 [Thermomicrobiales bacterium]